MGQATRTTKLPLDLGKRRQGGANTAKRAYLQATVWVFDAARAFYNGLRSYKYLIRAAALGKEVTDDQGTQDQAPSHA